ncbi:DUF2950 family protein [Bordetella pseudohinzii]|uniref:Protein of uncharacterized function (DUF2950) n=1 Tax=Bordetella pseudohinzii TaxID=1331258 RepID=A0A0M9I1U3_9BORD|nr:DUF2950 family protein [Bordetella pseudohinzii]ANY15236.1 hypothetical protein BBN53_04615 [Bordetella pseudohinzii]KXA77790.1 hypothetical protein AW877_13365 [Bordetella pseudohinzii]KXA79508.1 hypothetical protein AW878_09925 [Bordetella pseudohinzii]CUI49812.1 Protein of uncharacterised function (DUF2950) [Bordetella pseudohinzii]
MNPSTRKVLALLALSLALPAAQAQTGYASPEAAGDALVRALSTGDRAALGGILGAHYKQVLPNDIDDDDVYDFLAAWSHSHEMARDADGRAWMDVGPSRWRLPIPLAENKGQWRFDLKAAAPEIRRREIGRNELGAIETLRAIQAAQQSYASQHGGQYAQRLVSRRGQQDGLYWPSADNAPPSPLGIEALVMGPDTPLRAAYYGYRYAILPGEDGQGYRVAAWPARFGVTGVHRFIAGPQGIRQSPQPGRPGTATGADWTPLP